MKRVLAVLGGILGVLVLILVISAVLLVTLVDPNDYKEEIANAVQEATGREVQFGGDISFTFFPWIGLEVDKVSMLNPPGFQEEYFARVDQATVSVKFLPLLRRNVQMGTLTIQDMIVNLERTEEGRTNWEDLVADEQKQAEQPQQEPSPGDGMQAIDLTVEGIKIAGAAVTWDDRMAGQYVTISQVDLRTGEINPGEFFQLDLSFLLESRDPQLRAETSLNGQVLVDPEARVYSVKPFNLAVLATGEQFSREEMQASMEGFLSLNLSQQTLEIADLSLTALEELKVFAAVTAESILENPAFSGKMTISRFSPRNLLEKLNLQVEEPADENALRTASAEISFTGTTERIQVKPLQVSLDETEITGTAELINSDKPAYSFELDVNGIDMDRYLPAPSEDEGEEEDAASEEPAPGEDENPLAFLRDMRLNGQADIGWIKVMKIRAENATMNIRAQDGVARIDPLRLDLYGGSFQGNAQVDASGNTPTWSTQQGLTNVQMGPLVEDFLGSSLLTGTAQFDTALSGQGIETDLIMRTVDGTIEFLIRDGAIKGVNIPRMIRNAKVMLTGGSSEPEQERKTDFSLLQGTLAITDGLIEDQLLLKSPLLRVQGGGTVNLPKEEVDYLVNGSLVSSLEGQGGAAVEELRDIPVPIRIKGTLSKLSFTPDVEALTKRVLEQEAAQKVEQEIRERGQEVEKKLQQELQKRLPLGAGSGQGENATDTPLPSIPGLGNLFGGDEKE